MNHLTLNTGHCAQLPKDLVWPDTKEILMPLIQAGSGTLPGMATAFAFQITHSDGAAVFHFQRGREPLTINMVCWDKSGLHWPEIERVYFDLSDRMPSAIGARHSPTQPELPWIATVILPGLGMLARDDAGFIGHMAACFGLLLMPEQTD